jgi:hypothetical protein
MQLEQTIQPLNVAAATLLVQLLFMTLLAIASSLYDSQRPSTDAPRMLVLQSGVGLQLRKTPTLFVALLSFAVLLVSDELYLIWSPIFQGVGINTISAANSIAIVFYLDFALVIYLIACSGGGSMSPFVPALFTLPALAIFLRLPPVQFFQFTVVSAVAYIFSLLLNQPEGHKSFEKTPRQFAAAFMNIACLFLSMFTGYITRPVSIGELTPPVATTKSQSSESSAVSKLPTFGVSEPK